jgi:FKBP-type peptidyl-prolyl cis-trans isomerase
MGVEKQVLEAGDATTYPKKGDQVAMLYTGWLYDPDASDKDFKGSK